MFKTINFNSNILNHSLISFFIFINPFLIVYLNNYRVIKIEDYIYIIAITLIFFLLSLFISLIFKKYFNRLIIALSFIWWIQQLTFTNKFYKNLEEGLYFLFYDFLFDKYELFLFILKCSIIYFILVFAYLIFKKYNNYVPRFMVYFLTLNIFFGILSIVNDTQKVTFEKVELHELNKSNNIQIISKEKKSISPNIYFFLMDEMPSADFSEKNFNLNYNKYLKDIGSNNFIHFKNSKSLSNHTVNSLTHIFLLRNEKRYRILKRSFSSLNKTYFPNNLDMNKLPLKKILIKNKYNTVWFANGLIQCTEPLLKSFDQCIPRDKNYVGNFKSLITNFFIEQNFIYQKILKFFVNFKSVEVKSKETELKRFQVFFQNNLDIIKKQKNFIFVHNLSPHMPPRDMRCKLITGSIYAWRSKENWTTSIQCALNQLVETVNLVKSQDPSSVIIIQADHGTSYGSLANIRFRDIFNFVEYGDNLDCKDKFQGVRTNVDTVKAVFTCLKMIR